MGEYAIRNSDGQRVKIGTCESMYYMRADQINDVTSEPGNVNPWSDRFDIRFRFPFPNEDGRPVGDVDGPEHDFERSLTVRGITPPVELDHYTVQFKAANGYLVSLPCPENCDTGITQLTNGAEVPYKVHRNGYGGAVAITQQKWVRADEYGPERLVTVCECKGCGAAYRLHAWEDAEPVVVALRSEADKNGGSHGRMLHEIANRITAGYIGGDSATAHRVVA